MKTAGRNLFRGKGNCNSCHIDRLSTTLTPGQTDTGTFAGNSRPVFTCFGYSNLGLPLNPRDAFYYQTTPDFFGFIGNPFGFGYRDLGLGTFLRSGFGSAPNPSSAWTQFAPRMDGREQVTTVRNVAMAPPQCPTTEARGPYFQIEFFHNGYIKSLKQLVHFYNTRDVFAFPVTSGHCPQGTTEKVDCWPMAEVPNNIDMTVGRLGWTDQEENQIVIFMQTLGDALLPPKLTHPMYFTPFPRSHKNSAYWSRRLLRGSILERTPSQQRRPHLSGRTPSDVMRFLIARRTDSLISGGDVWPSHTF
jgi:cytochrome c peroxidase